MNVDTMRRIDYWIGIPICAFLSLFNFRKGKRPEKLEKVLFLKLSEMGSTVLAYPAMKYVKDKKAEIFFLAFEENKEIIKTLGIVLEENIISIRSKNLLTLVVDGFKALWRIRREKFDATIDLEFFARVTTIIAFLSGAKAHIGFYKYYAEGMGRGNFLTHRVNYNHYLHTAQSYFSLAMALDYEPGEIPMLKKKIPLVEELEVPQWNTSEEDKDELLVTLKKDQRLIVMNPNSSALIPFRKWPIERWVGLCRKLLEDKKNVLIFMGVESDRPDTEEIIEGIQTKYNFERIYNYIGKTTIPQLLHMFNTCDILISNDSGPAQFAAMTSIKIVSIFGPETPKLYGPLSKRNISVTAGLACTPCISVFNMRRTPCSNNLCLKNITVEQVYEAYKKHVEAVPPSDQVKINDFVSTISCGGISVNAKHNLEAIEKILEEKK